MKNIINNQKGFTLMELVLYIAVMAILLGVTTRVLISEIGAYSYVSKRQSAISDARYALNRISSELIHLETADILLASSSEIQFTDTGGVNTSFKLDVDGDDQAIYRGAEVMISPINNFNLTYYDQNNNVTTTISDIRKIEVEVITEPLDEEGEVSFKTMVTPRNFIYDSYQ
jgi:prepilin-type N-terminal cleavage/methylation domain-containing protein